MRIGLAFKRPSFQAIPHEEVFLAKARRLESRVRTPRMQGSRFGDSASLIPV